MRVFSVFCALAAIPAAAQQADAPDCYCLNRGARLEIGDFACLRIGSRQIWAQCGMSENTPTWRWLDAPCPEALSSLGWPRSMRREAEPS